MTAWTTVPTPAVGDNAASGADSYASTFGAINTALDELRGPGTKGWLPWDSTAPLGVPRLVAGNANSATSGPGANWTPTDGTTNPNLGSTGTSTGDYSIDGNGMVIARCTHTFSGTGVSGGSGPLRNSLPTSAYAGDYSSAVRRPMGRGQLYDDSAASASFGVGPTVYTSLDLHAAETITNDVVGLLTVKGLPTTGIQSPGYFWNSHTVRRGSSGSHLDVTTLTLQQLAEIVATMSDDLAALLVQNVLIDVANGSPITLAANDRLHVVAIYRLA